MQSPPPPTPAERPLPLQRVAAPSAPPAPASKAVHSEDLLQGHSSVALLHNGMRYTLRHTRQGKLILTK